MLKDVTIKIAEIYVPAGLAKELDPARVEELAGEMLEEGAEKPLQVREGKGRYVLVKGVHRLAAHKALGDDTVQAFIVAARQH